MSKNADGLIVDELDNRWMYTSTGTNVTLTASMKAAPISSKEVVHLDFFNMTILNKNTPTATVAAQIRDASIAGAVLAQWPLIVGPSQVAQVSPSDFHVFATPGAGLFFTLDTVQPSVTATVNAGGWTDQTKG